MVIYHNQTEIKRNINPTGPYIWLKTQSELIKGEKLPSP